MTEEQQKYIQELKHEFYSNTEWKDCVNCIMACRYPRYKNLDIGFVTGGIGKKMIYKFENEPTVTL